MEKNKFGRVTGIYPGENKTLKENRVRIPFEISFMEQTDEPQREHTGPGVNGERLTKKFICPHA